MSDHLITTRAKAGTCRRCGAITIAGHSEGYPAHCDPEPLDLIGEALALLQGRPTYDLWTCGGRIELVHRNRWRIVTREFTVLATHSCNAAGLIASIRDPAEWRGRKNAAIAPRTAAPQPAHDVPPY